MGTGERWEDLRITGVRPRPPENDLLRRKGAEKGSRRRHLRSLFFPNLHGGAILFVPGGMSGDSPQTEKFLAGLLPKNPILVSNDRREAAGEREEADRKSRHPPRVLPFVIAEIAFVTLGDLFLRSSRRGHDARLDLEGGALRRRGATGSLALPSMNLARSDQYYKSVTQACL